MMFRHLFPWLYESEPNLHNWTAWPGLCLPAGRGEEG